ncbi:MAG: UvrD-helicase domain-containing protein [Candidatus Paceibacterota bacterium]|jgi:DNA helicase IV
MEATKEQLLSGLRKHLIAVRKTIVNSREVITAQKEKAESETFRIRSDDLGVHSNRLYYLSQRIEELTFLNKTPYFIKCELVYESSPEIVTVYFATFNLSEEAIYSWVAPISSIRFENLGDVAYTLPSGEKKMAQLLSKEKFTIIDQKILSYTRETLNALWEVIYREPFTQRKSGFALPEIVAQMEKAQDQIIRAHHKGSLVISGPAGSGKTTLAFHRIAFLMQSIDTSSLFYRGSVIVFVQDSATKEYFSEILPDLGIKGVCITTFWEWAFEILNISGHEFTFRFGDNDEERDAYEYEKLKLLRKGLKCVFGRRSFVALKSLYAQHLSPAALKTFDRQKAHGVLDRFDLTFLLLAFFEKFGVPKERYIKSALAYSLILVDEFQNYLPEQLILLKRCLSTDTKSILYVGDMAQQINVGTIRTWDDIGENITGDKHVELGRVYRSTRQILSYIRDLGYAISVPSSSKDGPMVEEQILHTQEEQVHYIQKTFNAAADPTVGIIARRAEYLEPFRLHFQNDPRVHVLTMAESQGVEFDTVFIVGIDGHSFRNGRISDNIDEHEEEKKRIQKDLLYVALTRAMTRLYVLGAIKLSEYQP